MDIQNTVHVNSAFTYAQKKAISYRHEFITPEHLLSAFLEQTPFANALNMCFCDTQELAFSLENYFTEELESVPADMDYELEVSTQLNELIQHAYLMIDYSSAEALNVPHLVQSMLQLKDSWACHILKEALEEDLPEFISQLISRYEEVEEEDDLQTSPQEKSEPWRNFVTCLNDCLQDHNPLIGREAELERTIQVLCRKEKNNPLHVGEPGVGKTSLAYGLAARIEAREVPERLLDCRIYELDLGTLLAGTQYRGDFEKRLKTIMEGVRNEGHAIIYIDEIHNLIGAGRTGDGSMDASNMLKPYLESGDIRFIGSTTYEEYNRYFARSKGLVRRFQQIDILEPSIEETIHIVEGLKEKYEEFHGVTYHPDVIPYAVKASVRYISDLNVLALAVFESLDTGIQLAVPHVDIAQVIGFERQSFERVFVFGDQPPLLVILVERRAARNVIIVRVGGDSLPSFDRNDPFEPILPAETLRPERRAGRHERQHKKNSFHHSRTILHIRTRAKTRPETHTRFKGFVSGLFSAVHSTARTLRAGSDRSRSIPVGSGLFPKASGPGTTCVWPAAGPPADASAPRSAAGISISCLSTSSRHWPASRHESSRRPRCGG